MKVCRGNSLSRTQGQRQCERIPAQCKSGFPWINLEKMTAFTHERSWLGWKANGALPADITVSSTATVRPCFELRLWETGNELPHP